MERVLYNSTTSSLPRSSSAQILLLTQEVMSIIGPFSTHQLLIPRGFYSVVTTLALLQLTTTVTRSVRSPGPSTHQLIVPRGLNLLIYRTYSFTNIGLGTRFIPLALIIFVGLAGIATWLLRASIPSVCGLPYHIGDLCILEVFIISDTVTKSRTVSTTIQCHLFPIY